MTRKTSTDRNMPGDLRPCRNPLCNRKTTALYCCGACDKAHKGQYEIYESGPLGHAPSCNEKHVERSEGVASVALAEKQGEKKKDL